MTSGICARRDGEIVFELPLVAVIDQIDAGIKPADAHFGERRHAGLPLRRVVAGEVIDFAGQFRRRRKFAPAALAPTNCIRTVRRNLRRRSFCAERIALAPGEIRNWESRPRAMNCAGESACPWLASK